LIVNTHLQCHKTLTNHAVDFINLDFDQVYDKDIEAKATPIYTRYYEIIGFGNYAA